MCCAVMLERLVERLHDRVRLVADGHRALQVFGSKRVQGGKYMEPRLLPPAHHFLARRFRRNFKFLVAKTIGLLAVAGEEVGEARVRVAGNVFDQSCNGIRFRIKHREKISVFELSHGGFALRL